MTLDLQTPLYSIESTGPEPSGVDNLEGWEVSLRRLRGPRFEDHVEADRLALRLSRLCYAPGIELIDPIVSFTGFQASGFECSFVCQAGEIARILAAIDEVLREELDAEVIIV